MGEEDESLSVVSYALFSFASVMVILYFCWENGPHHQSHKIEVSYFLLVLVLLISGAAIMESNGGIVRDDSMYCEITGSEPDLGVEYKENRNVSLCDFLVVIYLCLHVFLLAIPDSSPQLEGVPLTQGVQVSHSVLRKVRDIENLVYDVHESGPAALKRMQVKNSFLAPLMLFVAVIRGLAWIHEGFGEFMKYALFLVFGLFGVIFLKQVYVVFFVNSKVRLELHEKIKEVMRKPHGLNFMLETINTALLIEEAPWETVELLLSELESTNPNLSLSVSTKAILVDALQKRGLRYNVKAEHAMERLLLSCHVDELTQLKNMTDLGGDYQNLYKLMYSDFTTVSIREKVLAHFETEAQKLRTERGSHYGIKVLSDVDDTLYSSGGKFPAGMDKEYPKHQLYPGCLDFFQALDKEGAEDESSCNLVFLSARPHAYKDMAEEHSYRLFKKLVREDKMHVVPTLLPGRLKQGIQAVVMYPFKKTLAWKAVGELKYITFEHYAKMYPEYNYVFCGDDGQGDLLAGELMKDGPLKDRVMAVFIHRVAERGAALDLERLQHRSESVMGKTQIIPPGTKKLAWDQKMKNWEDKDIFVAETYIHSAAKAALKKIIDPQQLYDISLKALEEFDDIRCMYPDRKMNWDEAEKDLSLDIVMANDTLEKLGWEGDKIKQVTNTQELFESDSRSRRVSVTMTLSTDTRRMSSVSPKASAVRAEREQGGGSADFV
ncbi:hypothetical protein TrST_g2027 [Triparma strigata]|uniref:Phosphatidate phosphatase APP1 catalytic domain-containing protein n=1 Tax=Triparma strigata TaxID=1606541 RepID=A0A9W7BED7_9STRA|nr:hypothetical protein TrST_g2027 [Triparma strigata]